MQGMKNVSGTIHKVKIIHKVVLMGPCGILSSSCFSACPGGPRKAPPMEAGCISVLLIRIFPLARWPFRGPQTHCLRSPG